ncbi:MAG: hypothetical protein WC875_06045, partial [Candidatus Absconditabacterales bacterium]
ERTVSVYMMLLQMQHWIHIVCIRKGQFLSAAMVLSMLQMVKNAMMETGPMAMAVPVSVRRNRAGHVRANRACVVKDAVTGLGMIRKSVTTAIPAVVMAVRQRATRRVDSYAVERQAPARHLVETGWLLVKKNVNLPERSAVPIIAYSALAVALAVADTLAALAIRVAGSFRDRRSSSIYRSSARTVCSPGTANARIISAETVLSRLSLERNVILAMKMCLYVLKVKQISSSARRQQIPVVLAGSGWFRRAVRDCKNP